MGREATARNALPQAGIYPYWKGKTLRERWNGQAPRDLLELIAVGGVIDNDIKIECAPGETTPEFPENIFRQGLQGHSVRERRRF